ncbi:MAG TPA: aminomethyl-transferring glycine dehydrogenase subunit GcvPA [Clostridia bacterium]
MSKYIPNTDGQKQEMLSEIGAAGIDDLFCDIPEKIRLKRTLNLPTSLSDIELAKHMQMLSDKNSDTDHYTCFIGAGAYDHYIPAIIDQLVSRQEFYTAYTPYQPEISQGTLQAIFEYQSMICLLTGMDVANASLYDGASAVAEAVLLACRATGRTYVLAAKTLHPESREVLRTYTKFCGITVEEYGFMDGAADLSDLEARLSPDTAAVVLQNLNFFGIIEDIKEIAELVHKNKSLLIISCDPISLALLKPPGELGADIVIGEGQSLGNSLSFGGPYLGFFAASKQLMRRIPGRIVGETVDSSGRRGFVLTLQTREQHIRREKATSNICTNHALNALAATIYLTVMGKNGLREAAELCAQKAHYAYSRLIETGKFSPVFTSPFFKEFAVKYGGDVHELSARLLEQKILAGYIVENDYKDMDNVLLVAITENRTKHEIDTLVERAVFA